MLWEQAPLLPRLRLVFLCPRSSPVPTWRSSLQGHSADALGRVPTLSSPIPTGCPSPLTPGRPGSRAATSPRHDSGRPRRSRETSVDRSNRSVRELTLQRPASQVKREGSGAGPRGHAYKWEGQISPFQKPHGLGPLSHKPQGLSRCCEQLAFLLGPSQNPRSLSRARREEETHKPSAEQGMEVPGPASLVDNSPPRISGGLEPFSGVLSESELGGASILLRLSLHPGILELRLSQVRPEP